MPNEILAYASATELVQLISTKQISPVELTELYFRRIHRLNPQLNAFLMLTESEALKSARAAEAAVMRGERPGLLHGLPVPIKDNQMTAGVRTTSGSLVYRDRIPERNSAVVERVLDAGAFISGKTNVPEFAMVGTCENRFGDPGRNPWNLNCTPGGSSGGAAAAVAAGLCPAALGSDGGGSLRIPAGFCGIYTLKPTQGRVSHYSGLAGDPLPNLFSQNGPLTRTVRDAAILLQVVAGYDPRDPACLREAPPDFVSALHRDIRGLRIAWSPDFGFADVHPQVAEVTSRAALVFEELGCHVEQTDLQLDEPYDSFGPIQAADAFNKFGAYLESHPDQLTEFARFFLETGARVTTAEYTRALGRMAVLKSRMCDLFEQYDLLLSPTARFPAFPNEEFPGSIRGESSFPEQYWNGVFTLPINVTGQPAASVPAGFSSEHLPIGLHIVGRHGDEVTVLAASAAFERARPWIQHRPPVS